MGHGGEKGERREDAQKGGGVDWKGGFGRKELANWTNTPLGELF